ncbi:UpsA domain-containing protein [Salinarchaeum sp. Harcht-Bsk1]|uniref:universal stress protein n=1 Tax=Salinarchaeum sp. Harcht-Bsk1 TaxID=1333523 RepID=UPI0003422C45|nr:universal stress protein [Salinarchaeum sp. Harcht-Bsk1]AGN01040.1 UpsA domain-containing protein [Salinarchaeum sp. Harcht-Bsk1]
MQEHLLVPYDGSPLSQRALERALTKHPDDRITVLYVLDPVLAVYEAEAKGAPAASTLHDRMTERADEICADAAERASEHGREITKATENGRPARTIVSYADDHDVDHIVMGSHGREGVSRLVLGSVAERVMRQAPMPVTIVR